MHIEDLQQLFKTHGRVASPAKKLTPICEMYFSDEVQMREVQNMPGLPPAETTDAHTLVYTGSNAIDFMSMVCPDDHRFNAWLLYRPSPFMHDIAPCKVLRTHPDAVIPSKARASDAGYDLTIVKKIKDFNSKTALYDTGVRINMVHGMYAEVVPRSSLSKSGYMLANSVGIIDNSYTGNILIALTKVDDSSPDLELPFRCCQLIFRHQIFVDIHEVDEAGFNAHTHRADKGFGSSSAPSS